LQSTHMWEVLPDHCADVLGVIEVQRRVDLVQDVQRRRLEPVSRRGFEVCQV
jgi:hypothetical protein